MWGPENLGYASTIWVSKLVMKGTTSSRSGSGTSNVLHTTLVVPALIAGDAS
jgi:hypothetical protein